MAANSTSPIREHCCEKKKLGSQSEMPKKKRKSFRVGVLFIDDKCGVRAYIHPTNTKKNLLLKWRRKQAKVKMIPTSMSLIIIP